MRPRDAAARAGQNLTTPVLPEWSLQASPRVCFCDGCQRTRVSKSGCHKQSTGAKSAYATPPAARRSASRGGARGKASGISAARDRARLRGGAARRKATPSSGAQPRGARDEAIVDPEAPLFPGGGCPLQPFAACVLRGVCGPLFLFVVVVCCCCCWWCLTAVTERSAQVAFLYNRDNIAETYSFSLRLAAATNPDFSVTPGPRSSYTCDPPPPPPLLRRAHLPAPAATPARARRVVLRRSLTFFLHSAVVCAQIPRDGARGAPPLPFVPIGHAASFTPY